MFGREQNWWGPPGPHGPCGPDSEVFFWTGDGEPVGDPESDPRWLEVGNNVFIGYDQAPDGTLRELPQHNVDVGMGLERMTCLLQGVESVYDTDLFVPIRDHVRMLASSKETRAERIVCDHVRSGVLLAGDGVRPSNTDQGYVLRRLLRRAVRQGRVLGIEDELLRPLGETVTERYAASTRTSPSGAARSWTRWPARNGGSPARCGAACARSSGWSHAARRSPARSCSGCSRRTGCRSSSRSRSCAATASPWTAGATASTRAPASTASGRARARRRASRNLRAWPSSTPHRRSGRCCASGATRRR